MTIVDTLEYLTYILDAISILIIVWGVLLAFRDFLRSELHNKDRNNTVQRNNIIKNHLGSYILFGLEVLIAADIIESILNPSVQDLIVLASIVVIRTVISYFLAKEIETLQA